MTTEKSLRTSLSFILTANVLFAAAPALAESRTVKDFTLVPGVSTVVYRALNDIEARVAIDPGKNPVQCILSSDSEASKPVESASVLVERGSEVQCTLSKGATQSATIRITYTVAKEPRSDLPELQSLDALRAKISLPIFHTREFVDQMAKATPHFEKVIQDQIVSLDSSTPQVTIEENAPANQLYVVENRSIVQEGITLVCESRTEAGVEIFATGNFASKTYRTQAPSSQITCTRTALAVSQKQSKKAKKSPPLRPPITLRIRRFNLTAALDEIHAQESKVIAQAKASALAQEKTEIALIENAANRQASENNQRNRLHLLEEKLRIKEQLLAEKNREIEKIQTAQNRSQQEQVIADRLAWVTKMPRSALAESDWKLVLNHYQNESQKAKARVESLKQEMQKARDSFAKNTFYSGYGYESEKEMKAFSPDKKVLKTRLLKRHYNFTPTPVEIDVDGRKVTKTALRITRAAQTLVEEHSQFTQWVSIPVSESFIITRTNWSENDSLSKENFEIETCWNQDPNFKSIFSDLRKQRSTENLRPSLEEVIVRLQASVQLRTSSHGKKSNLDCKTPSPKDTIEVDLVRGPVSHFCYLAESHEKNYDGYDRRNEIVLTPHRIKTEYMVYGNAQVIRYRDVTVKQMRNHEEILESIKGTWNNLYASTLGDEKNKETHPFFKTQVHTGLELHEGMNTAGEICVPLPTGFPKYEPNGAVFGAIDAYLTHAYGK